jgi:hypothetical protein
MASSAAGLLAPDARNNGEAIAIALGRLLDRISF